MNIDASMQLQVVGNCHDMVGGDGRVVLVSQTGSRAYGTQREDSDYDFKGVYVADNKRLFSLRPAAQTFDRQEPYDTTLFELAHFCKLAANANPTVSAHHRAAEKNRCARLWCHTRTSPAPSSIPHTVRRRVCAINPTTRPVKVR